MARTELHALAQARGVTPEDGSRCQLCGESPFPSAGEAAKVFGKGFSDYAWVVDGGTDKVCRGCQHLLAGKPGADPPPIRMYSAILHRDELRLVRPRDLWPYLLDPPAERFLLSWADSGKIHHWIRARWSSSAVMRIGHDRETIDYRPDRERDLLGAVHELLYSPTGTGAILSRTSIREGTYHPKAVAKFGAGRHAALETVVARYRPSLLLDLVCAAAPLSNEREDEDKMIDPIDQEAADLLADLAEGSEYRYEDGMQFWGGVFRHRLEQYKRKPLPELTSKLMGVLRVQASAPGAGSATKRLRDYSIEETRAVERAIRDHTDLLVTLAYEAMTKRREARKDKTND